MREVACIRGNHSCSSDLENLLSVHVRWLISPLLLRMKSANSVVYLTLLFGFCTVLAHPTHPLTRDMVPALSEQEEQTISSEFQATWSEDSDDGMSANKKNIKCFSCKNSVAVARRLLKTNSSLAFAAGVITQFCIRLKIQTEQVCRSLIPGFAPWLRTVLMHPRFASTVFCGAFNFCMDVQPYLPPLPPYPDSKADAKPDRSQAASSRTINILHLSDWHYDPEYKEGFESRCKDPICCRPPHSPGMGKTIHHPAGPFGEYKCDTPLRLAQEVLFKAKQVAGDALKMVVMSGDLPPHDIWNSSMVSVINVEEIVKTQLIDEFTPENASERVPVFMTVGNHESSNVNSFPAMNVDNADNIVGWLYKSLASQWNQWLPETSARRTMEKYGYYASSEVVPSLNLKVISVNTNHAYLWNWWIFVSDPDPDNIYSFLIEELHDAERKGIDVFLLGHIPAGGYDVSRFWREAFGSIVVRFSDTIKGQFYGHSHRDEFEIFYEHGISDGVVRPVNVAYMAPSITPFVGLNPAFRVYQVKQDLDSEGRVISNEIVNHETHMLDLVESNQAREPKWILEYDARSAYDMPDLSPDSWHNLTVRMGSELNNKKKYVFQVQADADYRPNEPEKEKLIDRYMRYMTRYIPGRREAPDPAQQCKSIKCKLKAICRLQSANSVFGKCHVRNHYQPLMTDAVSAQIELIHQQDDLTSGYLEPEDIESDSSVSALRLASMCV